MKTLLLFLLSLAAFVGISPATTPPAENRTIKEVSDVIPLRVLQRSISPKFYQSLCVSPIKGWIVVRGQLSGTHLSGIRVVRSSLNGAFDPLALKLAREVRISGAFSLDQVSATHSALMHLLIYQVADGTMALSFAHLDAPGGEQMQYFGCAKLSVLKSDGRWTEIKGPEGMQGKGVAVRDAGLKNNFEGSMKMENIAHHEETGNEIYHRERY